ncbi:hypothetical protein LTR72_011778 [Exophiala xenobiotica]|nr:hypothetical protein LTR92_010794 [Exophiala xenobiotica]KAK5215143.1 hypothetical protein LTR72_011778 [Exophiala xenobiotica]KAK5284115.1 hypothetical protein LTR14_011753 [Exophiala xenobiotica]KAK5461866.1 hypothetical protein LTR55_011884 [Exophiala xenobiotica]
MEEDSGSKLIPLNEHTAYIVEQYQNDLTYQCAGLIDQRTQTLRQNIHSVLRQYGGPKDMERRIEALEGENRKLNDTVVNTDHDKYRLRKMLSAVEGNRAKLQMSLNEVGLLLAQAYRFRNAAEDEVQSQLRARGISERTIGLLVGNAEFMQQLAYYTAPRRSERLLKSSKLPETEDLDEGDE